MPRLARLEAWIEWGLSQEGPERQQALQDAWLEVQEHRIRQLESIMHPLSPGGRPCDGPTRIPSLEQLQRQQRGLPDRTSGGVDQIV